MVKLGMQKRHWQLHAEPSLQRGDLLLFQFHFQRGSVLESALNSYFANSCVKM